MQPVTAASEYRRRAVRYRHWDLLLQPATRFFAAASIVAETLDCVDSPGGWLLTTPCSRCFLLQLGSDLECLNVQVARQLLAGPVLRTQQNLDFAIVRAEQRQVEKSLGTLCRRSPRRHRRTLADLNRLLAWLTCPLSANHSATRLLQCAVRAARTDLGRIPDFQWQSDRESIGNHLIGVVRERCRSTQAPAAD